MASLRFPVSLALALLIAGPVCAQQPSRPEPAETPGLVIVGHAPDVPNAEPADAVETVPVAPVLVIAVPVLIQPVHGHRHHADADPAAVQNPTGQFINDPSRRFINDPARRFINTGVDLKK